ncbi:MAG: sensor histidine kinase [Acidimicrobiales bacterium]
MGSWAKRSRAALRRRPLVTDGLVAGVLAVVGLLAVQVGMDTGPPGYDPPSTAVWVGLTLALILPLAWRRRFPLTALVTITAVFFPYRIVDLPDLTVSVVAWWLALYSAGAYGSRRRRDWVRGLNVVAALGFVAYRLLTSDGSLVRGPLLQRNLFVVLFNLVFVVAALAFGNTMARRREYETALVERAAELEREREEKARRAVFDERVRIARELHDVVAHHVSVMGLQAGAARRVLERSPAGAKQALSHIETASRQAVAELQRLLGFLRQEGDVDHPAPQPGLRQLDALAEEVRQVGLDVEVSVEGNAHPLPPTVELSVYRIVQEALTNTIRHAGATKATVCLRYEPRALQIDVTDDGASRPETARAREETGGGGHGLIGMRERAGLHGGRVSAGPRPEGGFGVSAVFPLDGS